ncbi:hypothetical protein [Actinocrispum wychmicini]|uniref:Tail protein n=1 Tax=Actinocrispum wychmicini TaxID=1213861 RepID=A0A4R2JBF1_9PSEU|nr:hypothetical protein [Actinocrispum wychmicini]TCO56803.1 hypothetical protein EV192_106278 [Actinocrispum wychmicini]
MFLDGGDAAEAAITSRERHFHIRIEVDWDKDGRYTHPLSDLSGYVSTVTTDRSLRGSAPEELMLIEGASAAELSLTVSGEYQGLSFTGVFSPYNGLSPFYLKDPIGAEIRYSIGIETTTGTVWYQQFVGNIRTITPDRADATVEITALDRVEKLRRPIQLPPWAMSEEHLSYGEIDSQLIRSHWVIDHCLRLCDTSVSPYRPTYREETGLPPDWVEGPQFFLTGNGSYLPTVGWLDNLNADSFPAGTDTMYSPTGLINGNAPPDTARPLAFAGLGMPIGQLYGDGSQQGIIRYWCADRDGIQSYATHYAGFVLNTNGPNARAYRSIAEHNVMEIVVGDRMWLVITINTGSVRARVISNGATALVTPWIPIPVDNRPGHLIFVQWDNSGTTGGRIYLSASENSNGGLVSYGGPVSNPARDDIKGRITIGQALSLSDVFYASRNYYGAGINPAEAVRGAAYVAVLDQGLNRFSHVPNHQFRDAWDIITDIAAAEYGSVFWDEHGAFRFLNYRTILAKQTSVVRTLTLDDVEGLQVTNSLDSVRNIYTVQARRKRAILTRVFEATDPNEFYVPGRTSKVFRIWSEDVLSPITFLVPRYTTIPDTVVPQWTDGVDLGFVAQWFKQGAWKEDNTMAGGGLDISVYFNALGYLTVRIFNGWDEPARLATNAGQAAFRFNGTLIHDFDTVPMQTRDQASINAYGARNLELTGDWYQDSSATSQMLAMMLRRTSKPIPATDAITIAGDPRLQLADCVQVRDPDGLGESVNLQIYGIRREFDHDKGLTDTLTVEMLKPPGVGQWDSRQYGRWDTTFTWS